MFGSEARARVAQAADYVKGDEGLAVWTVADDSDRLDRETYRNFASAAAASWRDFSMRSCSSLIPPTLTRMKVLPRST